MMILELGKFANLFVNDRVKIPYCLKKFFPGQIQADRTLPKGRRKLVKEDLKTFASLRNRVVQFLKKNPDSSFDSGEIAEKKLIEELHIHQIELEMQNEDLRLARENAERIQARYIDLYEFAPVGYVTLAQNGKIVAANLTAAKLLGIGKQRLLYHPFTDFVDPESQDILYFYLSQMRKSEINQSCELKLKKKCGTLFFARLEGIKISCEDSDHNEIRISLIDINESKLNAIALKESAERNETLLNLLPQSAVLLDSHRKVIIANQTARNRGVKVGEICPAKNFVGNRFGPTLNEDLQNIGFMVDENTFPNRFLTVIDDSNDAVCLMDLKGNIKAWNRMAEKMYGYSSSEAIKMSVFDLVPARFKQKTVLLLADISAGAVVKPFETKRIAKDGSVLDICLTATRMVENGKIVAIATTERDITSHNLLFASLKELPRRIIMAQEEERSRISQVLHGEFGQALIALKLFAVVVSADLPEENFLMRSIFDKIRAQLDKIIQDTRTLAHKLSPPGLKYVGLIPAIREMVETATTKKLKVLFFHNDSGQTSFHEKDIIVYRIVQEALQNIQKHSGASRARIGVHLRKTVFTLEVSDNGRGFDPALASSAKGLGLALMKQQAALIGGKLSIESQKGKGTSLKIRVPIKEKK